MANYKNSGTCTRFTLPSADDLDKSTGKILNGATFQSKRRAIELRGTEQEKNNFKSIDPDISHGKQASIVQRKHEKFEHSISNPAPSILFDKGNIDEPPKANGISEVDGVGKGSVHNSLANKMQNEILNAPATQFKTDAAVSVTKVGTNSIIVNARQRGNPVLKHIRNVPWEFGEVLPDYVLGQTTCALFLSLRYHNFNPEYIHDRLKQLGNRFQLRILLVQVDVKDPHASLKELSKICILADCTLILAWSIEEAGRYLETYKSYENKPADILQEKVDGDYQSKMVDCLTSVKSVNKTDAVTLMSNFGSLKNMVNASRDEISLCPGFGPQKLQAQQKRSA